MQIVIRVDSSSAIGSGHLMRTLALARVLGEMGRSVVFLCRSLEGDLTRKVGEAGFAVRLVGGGDWTPATSYPWSEDARQTLGYVSPGDVLVVDHYWLGIDWERSVKPGVGRLVVIDDLGDRAHNCDLLIDPNYYPPGTAPYAGLLPRECPRLVGPRYAMLRPEFREKRATLTRTYTAVRSLLVFFGGSDARDFTSRALEGLQTIEHRSFSIECVAGAQNRHLETLARQVATLGDARLHVDIDYMAALMVSCDLYLGAAGATTWERACLGLPSIVIATAENQIAPVAALAAAGYLQRLGCDPDDCPQLGARAVAALVACPEALCRIAKRNLELVDGEGAWRCAEAIARSHIFIPGAET